MLGHGAQEVLGDRLGDVDVGDALQSTPRGFAVHLDTSSRPSGVRIDRRRHNRHRWRPVLREAARHLFARRMRARFAPLVHVGDPVASRRVMAATTRLRVTMTRQSSKLEPGCGTNPAGNRCCRWPSRSEDRSVTVDAQQAFTLRAEQRLVDQRPAGVADVGIGRRLGLHGARSWRWDACLMQQERCRRLVDTALDGARIVHPLTPLSRKRMEEPRRKVICSSVPARWSVRKRRPAARRRSPEYRCRWRAACRRRSAAASL